VIGRNPSEFAKTGKAKVAAAGRDTARYPVESVSWFEAIEFCESLSRATADWTAARATTNYTAAGSITS
jgi:formylglycine-generating enzyme required for sulfatase activity